MCLCHRTNNNNTDGGYKHLFKAMAVANIIQTNMFLQFWPSKYV